MNEAPSAFFTFVVVTPKQDASLVNSCTVAWVLFESSKAISVGSDACPFDELFGSSRIRVGDLVGLRDRKQLAG